MSSLGIRNAFKHVVGIQNSRTSDLNSEERESSLDKESGSTGTGIMATFIEDYAELTRRAEAQIPSKKWLRVESHPVQPSTQAANDDAIFHGLLLSGPNTAKRNPWAIAAALTLELLLLAVLVIAPLYRTETLPIGETVTRLYLQPPPAAGATATKTQAPRPPQTSTNAPAKPKIPTPVRITPEAAPATPAKPTESVLGGIPGGVAGGIPGGVVGGIVPATRTPIPVKAPEVAPVRRIRVAARVAEANLVHDVPPQYPPDAGRARIEGSVVLIAVIGEDGTVKEVRVESGLPLLAQAAMDAVKQWRYKPYLVDGQPVEIDSRITINFTMTKG